jgi:hypothetical protein
MKEMLIELLKDYTNQFQENKQQCLQMIKEGKPEAEWQEIAKKGAGLKMMIEATILELKSYSL